MSTSPSLLLGRRNSSYFLESRIGELDFGVGGVVLTARTHRLAPAGVGGNCRFRALYFAFRYKIAQSVLVTVLVDDVAVMTDVECALPEFDATHSATWNFALSVPVLVMGVEKLRLNPQGTWIQVQIVASHPFAPFAIDGVDVEWEQLERRF